MSVCLYTSLFTLADRDPKQNHYSLMFLIWLTHIQRYANLSKDDHLYVLMDERTIEEMKKNPYVAALIPKLACPFQILSFPPPSSLKEGFMRKFAFNNPFTQKNLLYLDIDILVKRPLSELLSQAQPDRLYVHFEGPLSQHDYGAHLSTLGQPPPPSASLPGASAGKFLITGRSIRDEFFPLILHEMSKPQDQPYYTVDQPFFNAYMYILASNKRILIDGTLFISPKISTNFNNYKQEETVLLDLMGEPGQGFIHLEKMIGALCIL